MSRVSTLRVVWAGLLAVAGCATGQLPAGKSAQMYEIAVASVNGQPTANRGPGAYPACTIQVGPHVARVWLAHPDNLDAVSPVVLTGDAASLKEGILVERTWREAVVHPVTDDELAVGVAVVYVPGLSRRHTIVELRFVPVASPGGSGGQRQDDLSKDGPRFERAMANRDLR